MRIPLVVFHTECIYSRGGEKYLFELLKRLSKTHAITLHVHNITPYWRRRYGAHGISIRLFWTPPHLYWPLLPITLLVNVVQLRGEVKSDTLVYSTNFPVNLLAVLLSRKTLCHCFEPLAIFYDRLRIESLPPFSRFCVRVAKALYAWLDIYAVRHSKLLTTLNTSVTPSIVAAYGRRPDAYIANGVDATFFSPKHIRRIPLKDHVLGHSTDYTVFKGTEQFLAALSLLRSMKVKFHATISETINDKSTKKKYEGLVRQWGLRGMVHFVGTLTEKQLVGFYRSLDVFCYTGSPHSAGGSTASLSVLEAQACGIPVVRSMGNTDEILNGTTGYYVNPDNPHDVANKIARMVSLPPTKKAAMKRAARLHVLNNHSWDISVAQLHGALATLTTRL